jgi:hypothetical protein
VTGAGGQGESEARQFAEAIAQPGFSRWLSMAQGAGGCEEPVRLIGRSMRVDVSTGEVLTEFSTAHSNPGYVLVACGNRRASRCEPCSRLYKADTFHLVRAGLVGGKGVPEDVRSHPRLFVTLTAPSFGPVHSYRTRANGGTLPRRPRRTEQRCPHGRPLSCQLRHPADDAAVGQPLCAQCYDYPGAVLWNANAGDLWRRTTIYIRDEIAKRAGISRTALKDHVRLSYVKVAEFQARGVVHFHVIVRLDGADGPTTPTPEWADVTLLAESMRAAISAVALRAAYLPESEIRWGRQLDIRAVLTGDGESGDLTEQAVAAYIAKYATKSAEVSGTVDRPIRSAGEIATLRLPEHVRAMISTAWELGGRHTYRRLGLRRWAHMLGYRGHFSTKSRAYSTTLAALRQVRSDYRKREATMIGHDPTDVATDGCWSYAGQGYLSMGEAAVAGAIREARRPQLSPDPRNR